MHEQREGEEEGQQESDQQARILMNNEMCATFVDQSWVEHEGGWAAGVA